MVREQDARSKTRVKRSKQSPKKVRVRNASNVELTTNKDAFISELNWVLGDIFAKDAFHGNSTWDPYELVCLGAKGVEERYRCVQLFTPALQFAWYAADSKILSKIHECLDQT